MVISSACMDQRVNLCVTASLFPALDVADAARLAGINRNVKTAPYSVASVAALPPAACNMGRLIYVVDIDAYRISNGVSWTGQFVSTTPFANLFAWGSNTFSTYSTFGDGTTTNKSTPWAVTGEKTWCQVSAGNASMGAIKTNGTAWTWGSNYLGSLGDGTTIPKIRPVTVSGGGTWCQISMGRDQSAGIQTNGSAWSWGKNTFGQLGDGTTINRSSPVQLAGVNTNWCRIRAGVNHTVALKDTGTLYTWGINSQGHLGDGTATNRSSPGTIAGGGTWCQISAGYHTTAIKSDGTAWGWGRNGVGQLGDGTAIYRSSPVTVVGVGCWRQISSYTNHTVAVKTDGVNNTLWAWGWNIYGQLGDGTIINKSSPVQVAGAGTNWCQVSARTHTTALKSDGCAWSWGRNTCGQLGDNTRNNRCSPGSVAGGISTWCQISNGFQITMGLTT